jgi:inorganic pyrophosphatase
MPGLEIEVVVEIPRGARNKYEMHHETGAIWLDRMLFTATVYPVDYGFVPETLAEDGDPLDALVLLEEPTFPGCHIRARAVGVLTMEDEKGRDVKVLCVPATDPRWAHVTGLSQLPEFSLEEIAHFFEVYKSLEPGKRATVGGWRDASDAEGEVVSARARFRGEGGSTPANEPD